jgi:hypothetical protein
MKDWEHNMKKCEETEEGAPDVQGTNEGQPGSVGSERDHNATFVDPCGKAFSVVPSAS